MLNAGDGSHEHPTQALLDLFSIREHFKDFEGLKVGDRRRHPSLPGGPQQRQGTRHDGGGRDSGRTADADPRAGDELGSDNLARPRLRSSETSMSATCCECRRSDSTSNSSPRCSEYAAIWGLDSRRQALMRRDVVGHAPRPDEQGRRDRGGRVRVSAVDHPRPGGERAGGAHEPALPDARWRRGRGDVEVVE